MKINIYGQYVRTLAGKPGITGNRRDNEGRVEVFLPNANCSDWAPIEYWDPDQLTFLWICPQDWVNGTPEGWK